MSEVDRRYTLQIEPEFRVDLRECQREDRDAFDEIIVFIQELNKGIVLPENLIDEHFSDENISKVEPFWHLHGEHLNVYTVRFYNIGNWRVLSAGDHNRRRVSLLALMRRDKDYQSDHVLMDRIREAYERINFKKLG